MKRTFKNWILVTIISISALSSCKKDEAVGGEASSNPQPSLIEPGQAASNAVLTLNGTNIGGITSIMFETDSVVAGFNPNFNTDGTVIFRVPTEAVPGNQNIIFKNSAGVEFKVPFNVLGLVNIIDVSNYNYVTGSEITLTGKNLADVTEVVVSGTNQPVEIVSKTATSVVVKMPAITQTQVKLAITNEAGTTVTTQEFVNFDLTFRIFAEGYENGFENGSWGPAEISSTVAKSGTKSFKATYNKGNWSADGFANWGSGMEYSPDYKFLSFWVKGAANTYTFYITGDQRAGGYGNSDDSYPIVVPANVWTYFKIKLSDLELWKKSNTFKQLGFFIKGPDDQDATLHFDDVLFIK